MKQEQGLHGGERMYRFKKDSRVRLSVSLVLYCGKDAWDGPETLHGMASFADRRDSGIVRDQYRPHIRYFCKEGSRTLE